MNRPFLKKWLPLSLKIWLDLTNWPSLKKLRAKFGLLEPERITEILSDPSSSTIFLCAICFEAVKGNKRKNVPVLLSHRDRTLDFPEVKIEKEQTLWVNFRRKKYQVCCVKCGNTHAEGPDRFGNIDNEGNLLGAFEKINGHKNGHTKTPPQT